MAAKMHKRRKKNEMRQVVRAAALHRRGEIEESGELKSLGFRAFLRPFVPAFSYAARGWCGAQISPENPEKPCKSVP